MRSSRRVSSHVEERGGMKHPERHEQNSIRGLLTSLGGTVFVLGTTRRKGDFHGTMQTPGLPDLIAFLPGRDNPGAHGAMTLLVVECKSKTGRLRPEQAVFRDLCLRSDVHHIVGGVDDVLKWLIDRGYVKASDVPHYRLPKNLQEHA